MSPEPLFKRRKLNENARVLTKPFVSPLKTPQSRRKPLQQNDNARNLPYQPSVLTHTIKATPIQSTHTLASENVEQTPAKSTRIRKHPVSRTSATHLNAEELAAQRALTALELQIRNVRNEIDTLAQAARLSSSPTDAKLKDLAQKWKGASQAAAEEVFETVKQRVNHMGGVASWRRSERQMYERNNGWDHEERDGKAKDADCEFDSDGEELLEEEKERRREKKRMVMEEIQQSNEMNEPGEEEGEEAMEHADDEDNSFTMEMMLQSLNIELEVLGYDKATQTWIP